MKIYTHEEIVDEFIGKSGSAEREDFEAETRAAVEAYRLGESTLSKVENGHGTSTKSLFRIFRALGATSGSLDLGHLGRVALW